LLREFLLGCNADFGNARGPEQQIAQLTVEYTHEYAVVLTTRAYTGSRLTFVEQRFFGVLKSQVFPRTFVFKIANEGNEGYEGRRVALHQVQVDDLP